MRSEELKSGMPGGRRPPFSVLVAEKLRAMIAREKLKPGARLPTEAKLCERYGVSRTVIREAIVTLRSEGHLTVRQGVGVFVAESNTSRFEIDINSVKTLPKTIMLFELRLAIETEAAGLSALRRTKADAANIRHRMEKSDAEKREPKNTNVWYDHQFHLAIAKASKNPHIYQMLKILAPVAMPQIKLAAFVDDGSKNDYYNMVHAEHESIVAAIEAQDEEAARRNMRAHIAAAISRFRKLTDMLPHGDLRKAYQVNPELMRSLAQSAIHSAD